jgi:radical S-adenosyl methionine domain-containing protein 2
MSLDNFWNPACKFCFHTDISSENVPLSETKRGLKLLADAGMVKINISGGEPSLQAPFVGEIIAGKT